MTALSVHPVSQSATPHHPRLCPLVPPCTKQHHALCCNCSLPTHSFRVIFACSAAPASRLKTVLCGCIPSPCLHITCIDRLPMCRPLSAALPPSIRNTNTPCPHSSRSPHSARSVNWSAAYYAPVPCLSTILGLASPCSILSSCRTQLNAIHFCSCHSSQSTSWSSIGLCAFPKYRI